MDPLSVVERYLGAVETWPTITLRYLFVEEPTQRRILVVTKYLYLNNVPVDEAVQCFTKCNGGHSEYVAAQCASCTICSDLTCKSQLFDSLGMSQAFYS